MENIDRIITAPVTEFCKLAGIGRSLVYEMIGDGRLESIKIGKRRLILVDSYRRLIEQQRLAQRPPNGRNAPHPRMADPARAAGG